MNTVGWIILLVLGVPLLGLLAWVILDASLVRIRPGRLGLVTVRGRPTDTALDPGVHFVPALRRRTVQEYPALEMAYRAGTEVGSLDSELHKSGPALPVILGDRATALVSYTVRFRLVRADLRLVHDRYGPDGLFPVVRDESARVISDSLAAPRTGVEDFFGMSRTALQDNLGSSVAEALRGDGMELVGFHLGAVDLGRTGEVIQATLRARFELEREQAEAATRAARVANDAAMQTQLSRAASELAWRYREPDLLNDLIQRTQALNLALRTPASEPGPIGSQPADGPQPIGPSGA